MMSSIIQHSFEYFPKKEITELQDVTILYTVPTKEITELEKVAI